MLTVTFGCEGSGNNTTFNPFASWYSVKPSTLPIFWGAAAS